jgi:antitoxin component YwqK of YwqJK toxin-antitoxin module
VSSEPFVEGLEAGLARQWSPQHRLLVEKQLRDGALHGAVREWFEDGRQRRMATYENGICLAHREWNEAGELIKDYVLPADHPHQHTLELMRARERRQQGDTD